jgi:hypothetical protein
MASTHVWECDECGYTVHTRNQHECLELPEGWTDRLSEKGLACSDCSIQLRLFELALPQEETE